MNLEINYILLGIQLILLFFQLRSLHRQNKLQNKTTEIKIIDNCEKYQQEIINLFDGYEKIINNNSDNENHTGKFNTEIIKRKLQYLKNENLNFYDYTKIDFILEKLNLLNKEIEEKGNYKNILNDAAITQLKEELTRFNKLNRNIFIKSDIDNMSVGIQLVLLKNSKDLKISLESLKSDMSNISRNIQEIRNYIHKLK